MLSDFDFDICRDRCQFKFRLSCMYCVYSTHTSMHPGKKVTTTSNERSKCSSCEVIEEGTEKLLLENFNTFSHSFVWFHAKCTDIPKRGKNARNRIKPAKRWRMPNVHTHTHSVCVCVQEQTHTREKKYSF